MHADGKSTLASVSKWNSGKVNWAQLVIISFSSAVRGAKRYSKNQNIFVGFSEMLKNYGEKLNFVKNCFHILPWTNVKEQES